MCNYCIIQGLFFTHMLVEWKSVSKKLKIIEQKKILIVYQVLNEKHSRGAINGTHG